MQEAVRHRRAQAAARTAAEETPSAGHLPAACRSLPGGLRRVSPCLPPPPSTRTRLLTWPVEQFRLIADYLNIDRNDRDRLLLPKRAVTVALPIHRDDGSTTRFHRLPRPAPSHDGADQGRHALRPERQPRRDRRALDLDELEMRARRPALRRRQGRHHGQPARPFASANWRPSAAATCRR